MKKHRSLTSKAMKSLAIILPVAITAAAVAEVRESGTVRSRRIHDANRTAKASGQTSTARQPKPAKFIYDDAVPYLQPVPTQEQSPIKLVSHRAGRSRRNSNTTTHRSSSGQSRGILGRLFNRKPKTGKNLFFRESTGEEEPKEEDNTVYIPFDHSSALKQHQAREATAAQRPAAPAAIPQQKVTVQHPTTPQGTVRAVPAAVNTIDSQVQAITQRQNVVTQPTAAPQQMAPQTFPAPHNPIPAPPAIPSGTIVQDEIVEDFERHQVQVTPVTPMATPTPALQRNPLYFDDPFTTVSEREADGIQNHVAVQQPVEPFDDHDDFVIEENTVVEQKAAPAMPKPRIDYDPSLSPYTGVTLDERPFEVKTVKRPARFPGVQQGKSMNRTQMMKLVSSRNDVIGFKGFCPVALLDRRRLVDTVPEYKARFGLKTYYFSTADARNRFEQNPTRYLPVAGGHDVVRLAATDEEVKGKLDHAAWYRGRLYLFESAETRHEFFKRPTEYVNKF